MKKSLRILSLILAVVMVMGSMSVMASAYASGYVAYRGDSANVTYDDVDIPKFSVDQYASMALDAVDKLLAEKHLVVDIYIGTLDLSSVDGTVNSIRQLIASVRNIMGLLGDGVLLKGALESTILAGDGTSRSEGDFNVICDVLDLVGAIRQILYKYVKQDISLGIVNGFVKDYIFNVRELVLGLIYGLTGLGDVKDENGEVISSYDYMKERSLPSELTGTGNIPMKLAQMVLNKYVLGEWKKLDDLFYGPNNKGSNVVYSEYEFHVGSANGALVTDAQPNTTQYDYYGYVHPDRWVTQTLGDAIRVANGAAAPQASYSKLALVGMPNTYDFVEPLLLYAWNNVAVPVLNRITKRWLNEKVGYHFDENKTREWMVDENGNQVLDENGKPVRNPDYDYMYMGDKVEGAAINDAIFEIFDMDNFMIPRAKVTGNGQTFIQNLNRNATLILPYIFKGSYTVGGQTKDKDFVPSSDNVVYRFTWTGKNNANATVTYTMDWTYGSNDLLEENICSLLRFLLKVTEDEFFSDILVNKGQLKSPDDIDALSNDALLAYVLRSVINANVKGMWIKETAKTQTLLGAGFEAVLQLAYQDIPQFTYTLPDNATKEQTVEKALAILMDVAAYKLNAELDTNITTDIAANAVSGITNNGSTNNTGLLSYLGNGGSYGSTVVQIAKWAVKTYTNTSQGNILNGINPQLLGSNPSIDSFWNDLDTVINAIIPVKSVSGASSSMPDNRPWISSTLAAPSNGEPVIKNFIFNYLVYPVVELGDGTKNSFSKVLTLFEKNGNGALASDTFEVAIVDTLHRIFDLLFPDVFSNSVNTLDGVLNNNLLAGMIFDLAVTLSANGVVYPASQTSNEVDQTKTNGGTIHGRGKVIAEFALPIVCMILGLSDRQEFKELQNFVPDVITTGRNDFQVYNGSVGVNTAYRSPETGKLVKDKLFTYQIQSVTMVDVNDNTNSVTPGGIAAGNTIEAGKALDVYINGATNNTMYKFDIVYKVKDETGNFLKVTNPTTGNLVDAVLTSRKYVFCGAKGIDEVPDKDNPTQSVSGYKLLYPTDVYITGGLGSLDNYAIRIVDKEGTSARAQVTAVNGNKTIGNKTWIQMNPDTVEENNVTKSVNDQTLAGQGATYIFTPFKVNENAKREEFDYEKDEDDKVIYNETTGLPKIIGDKALEDADDFYVPYGTYALNTTVTIEGVAPITVTTYVHVFNDWGLPSLVNNAIDANRTVDNLTTEGQNMFGSYETALKNAAAFVLAPKNADEHGGANFDTTIAAKTWQQGNNVNAYNNKYAQHYAALYEVIEAIKDKDAGSNPDTMFTKVDEKYHYNYSRVLGNFDGTQAYYRDYLEYDENGYDYSIGMRNFKGHTYKQFKSAVEYATGLIEREHKYINGNPDDWADLSDTDRANRIAEYERAVENKQSINSISSAIAIHRLETTFARLIPLTGASKDKLNLTFTLYGGESNANYSISSWRAYTRAKNFAEAVKGEANPSAEKINRAMNELIEAWKYLDYGADYTALIAEINTSKTMLYDDFGGIGLGGGGTASDPIVSDTAGAAAEQLVYTVASFKAFLDAIKAGDKLLADRANGDDLGLADQDIIDNARKAIYDARTGLVPVGQDPGGNTGGDDENEPVYELITYEVGDEPFETFNGQFLFAPEIRDLDSTFLSWNGYTTVEGEYDEDLNPYAGEEITGVIVGVPDFFDSSTIAEMFETEYCEVEVLETENGYGTGSLAVIKDEKGNILECYIIILKGDIDCNGMSGESTDATNVEYYAAEVPGFYWMDDPDDLTRYVLEAAEVNGDDWVDTGDVTVLDYMANNGWDFNPITYEVYSEE